ncbi:MAG TPA: YdeI/OmpD-associated family protein [Candidatus Dormibacteraeota bacterium]|jgi:uncharacterized protein YdeI (YjbR/CyaY-like superfamily)|nr:YdeI/OmpD-associated family protein [Candidatus Dormibacteraeota bacterium]
MPTPQNVLFFATPAELRAWFQANHDSATELWLGYHRKRTGRPSVTWQEVVDQELCFGWIDSVRYSLDDDRSAQRITPRRKRSVWSAINIKRFGELEAMGLVHPAGRAAFEKRDEARSRIYSYENRSRGFDAAREAEFRKHKLAWTFFEAQPPSYRKTAAFWVMSAKRDETRERRLMALIERSQNRERLPHLVSPSRRPRTP